jgi:hypothetical protein
MLHLVSYFYWKIHLSIFLYKISTYVKYLLVGANVVSASHKQCIQRTSIEQHTAY